MRVPIWASFYIIFIATAQIAWVRTSVSRKDSVWYTTLQVLNTLILLLLFAGYWLRGLVRPMGVVALLVFLVSLIWSVWSMRHEIAQLPQPISELHRTARRVAITVTVAISLPFYWLGGVAALEALH